MTKWELGFCNTANRGIPLAPSSRKLEGLQLLRGIAALMVVMRHLQLEFEKVVPNLALPLPLKQILNAGQNGVDLFFVISGFVMVYSSRRHFGERGYVLEFVARRVSRVVPIYWFYTTIYIAIMAILPVASARLSHLPSYILASYFFIPTPNPVTGDLEPVYGLGWTLNYEMYFYVLFAGIVGFAQTRAVSILSLIFICISVAGIAVAPSAGPLWFWSRPIILEFLAGAMIAHAFSGDRIVALQLRALLMAAAFGLWVIAALLDLSLTNLTVVMITAIFLVVAMVSGPINLPGPAGRFFLLVGDASYSVYLCHMFVVRGASVVTKWIFFEPARAAAMAAIVLVATPLVAIASYHFLERPLTRVGYQLSRWKFARR